MFDITQISRRYYTAKLLIEYDDDDTREITLDIEPPKLKVLRKLEQIMKKSESPINDIVECMFRVLKKNKAGYTISKESIENSFNVDEMAIFLNGYFGWVKELNNDPN